ncbi:MAG: hypothetical protein OHK0037_09430 [Elainellaceae cyanobacterium]
MIEQLGKGHRWIAAELMNAELINLERQCGFIPQSFFSTASATVTKRMQAQLLRSEMLPILMQFAKFRNV